MLPKNYHWSFKASAAVLIVYLVAAIIAAFIGLANSRAKAGVGKFFANTAFIVGLSVVTLCIGLWYSTLDTVKYRLMAEKYARNVMENALDTTTDKSPVGYKTAFTNAMNSLQCKAANVA